MAPRHRSSRRGSARTMESTRWTGNVFSFNTLSAGSQALTFLTASNDPPETILRIRGDLLAYLDSTATPGARVDVAVGIALVPEGSSTTVVWSPITDVEAPWFLYERFSLGYEEMVTDVIDIPNITGYRKTLDVKSMRIVRPDVEAQIVVEQATLSGADAINLSLSARVLLGST